MMMMMMMMIVFPLLREELDAVSHMRKFAFLAFHLMGGVSGWCFATDLWDMWLQAAQAPLEVDPDDEDAQQHLLDIHRRSLQDLYS